MTARLPVPPTIAAEIAGGALFAISHSGGKDSQAMTILLSEVIPAEQIVVVHAPLGRVEWPGTLRHIQRTTEGLPLILAEARTDLLAMVRRPRTLADARHPAVHLGPEARADHPRGAALPACASTARPARRLLHGHARGRERPAGRSRRR